MKKAYLHLIRYTLQRGYLISVFDDEGTILKRTTSCSDIKNAIEDCEEVEIGIWHKPPFAEHYSMFSWALIVPDLSPEKTVADYSNNEFMNSWERAYVRDNGGVV